MKRASVPVFIFMKLLTFAARNGAMKRDDKFYVRIGEQEKKLRLENQMTIVEVAEKAGVDEKTIRRFEKASNYTDPDIIKAIVAVYGIKLSAFLSMLDY